MNLRRRAQKGQAAVELCFVLPVCLLLFMGVYTAGSFISDLNVAGQATRAGSRLGAELGNYGYGTSTAQTDACMGSSQRPSPCSVDQNIVTAVTTITKGMNNVSSFDEIDIYDPCTASAGGLHHHVQPVQRPHGDRWQVRRQQGPVRQVQAIPAASGRCRARPNYTLDMRTQLHPNELAIGVRILYHFQASAPIQFFNMQTSQYSVMCFAPSESGT